MRYNANTPKIAAVTAIAVAAVAIPTASADASTPTSHHASGDKSKQTSLSAGLPSGGTHVQPDFFGDVVAAVAGGVAGAYAAAQFAAPAAEVAAEASSSSSSSSSSGNAFNYNTVSATDSLDIQFDAPTS